MNAADRHSRVQTELALGKVLTPENPSLAFNVCIAEGAGKYQDVDITISLKAPRYCGYPARDSRGAARILMVDDQPANLLALEAILDGYSQDLVRCTSLLLSMQRR